MNPSTYEPSFAQSVITRYSDAYLVGRTIDGFGDTIKGLGIVFGIIIAIGAFVVGSQGGMAVLFAFGGLVAAVSLAVVLYLLGTMVSAQGQILKAGLDAAVNTSTFLNNADRARIMALHPSAPPSSGSETTGAAIAGPWKCHCGYSNATDNCRMCGGARIA
jgi:hypothetical protein